MQFTLAELLALQAAFCCLVVFPQGVAIGLKLVALSVRKAARWSVVILPVCGST
jgi:hypothetical protein